MFEVGQEVTVITDKGIGYNGFIMARATGADGLKAYKVSIDGAGLQQIGQWHKASDVYVMDPQDNAAQDMPQSLESLVEGITKPQ
jgi:hypothetical protein